MKLCYDQTISPLPIFVEGVGYVLPPTLQRIWELGFLEDGTSIYDGYLQRILTDKTALLSLDKMAVIPEDLREQFNIFDWWCAEENGREALRECLSFFICGEIQFNETLGKFLVKNPNLKGVGIIDSDSYPTVRSVILQLNMLESNGVTEVKPKNKLAQKIHERLSKAALNTNKKQNDDMNRANVTSALGVMHPSYNYTNIWSLTVTQLYDHFFRQNINFQLGVMASRWAAWGQDPFEFDIWYKQQKITEE